MTDLNRPLQDLKGVGEAQARHFASAKVQTVYDLTQYFPRRYDDYSRVTSIGSLRPGAVTIKAVIKQAKGRYARRGLHITEAAASDNTGSVRLVWFNQPYRAASLKPDTDYFIAGEFGLHYRHLSIMNPAIELVSDFPVHAARIIPVYRETKDLRSTQIRRVLREAVPDIRTLPEQLPEWTIRQYKLMAYHEAVEQIHFPKDSRQLEQARRRLAFQEVFELILASLMNKSEITHEPAFHIAFHEDLAKQFVGHLPFKLTDAQRKVIWQIYQDMQREHPMNRLVEGDVGSGKTVVAAMAALMVHESSMQTAFMAPTEILAQQHAETMVKLLKPLGLDDGVVLLTGSMKAAQKKHALTAIAEGRASVLIGTHALIQERVDMHRLALVVIDEQHRFGVEQRKSLMAKAGNMPHVLSLTATPIPRSLALTLYGELDISLLDVKPEGRQPIKTEICSPNSRPQLYEKITEQLKAGRQMFVVCPLISEDSGAKMRSAEETYKDISKDFKGWRVGLLHGKMKAADKSAVMEAFVRHELDILVSTTVIEVGVDVPNASIMLIESAERFGLAQIHQLRGRVGRGGHQGFCYLMTSDSSAPSQRLRALQTSNDGFKLAELDLELRGPGAIYGAMQHGALDLRIANLTDVRLIADARTAAQEFLKRQEDLLHYTELSRRVDRLRTVTNLN